MMPWHRKRFASFSSGTIYRRKSNCIAFNGGQRLLDVLDGRGTLILVDAVAAGVGAGHNSSPRLARPARRGAAAGLDP